MKYEEDWLATCLFTQKYISKFAEPYIDPSTSPIHEIVKLISNLGKVLIWIFCLAPYVGCLNSSSTWLAWLYLEQEMF